MRLSRLRPAASLLLLAVVACGSDGAVERDPDALVRISSGLYGEKVGEGTDYVPSGSEGSGRTRFPGHEIHIHAGDAALSEAAPAPIPLRAVKTSETGFFEVELAPGRYQVCAPSNNGGVLRTGSCARFEVRAEERVRGDHCVCRPPGWTIAGVRAAASSER